MHSYYFSPKKMQAHLFFFLIREYKAYCHKNQSLPKPTVRVQVSLTAQEK